MDELYRTFIEDNIITEKDKHWDWKWFFYGVLAAVILVCAIGIGSTGGL